MGDELAILRKLAANPYDRGTLGVYADWLKDQGREEEEADVRRVLSVSKPANTDVNSMTVGELVGVLIAMPLDVPVIYRACSEWSELSPGEVSLHRAEEQMIIRREQNGYMSYNPRWDKIERPNFVTVCCFLGN